MSFKELFEEKKLWDNIEFCSGEIYIRLFAVATFKKD